MSSDARYTFLTDDGSRSVFAERFGASYHSTHGALQETRHVFVEAGLAYVSKDLTHISILDVGYGTGLNFLCSAAFAKTRGLALDYLGLEAYPLEEGLISELCLGDLSPPYGTLADWGQLTVKTKSLGWNAAAEVESGITLEKRLDRLEEVDVADAFNLIYFDAFAPNHQPELWTLAIFERVYRAMRPGAVFVTYCARGQVRRDLRALGLKVERLAGPPGKREMLRGVKAGG